uniref:AIG1-type G domain-containing protein n=1 Tax=Biomphalaria glabrata TaxID=6526 RepID=A0A2C9JW55_BIOGL
MKTKFKGIFALTIKFSDSSVLRMTHYSQLNLMLIGKSGNGKSATGNSILRRRCFRTSGSATSVTNKVDLEVGKFDSRKLKVVDVPGVCDNSMENKAGVEFVMNSLQQAIYLCPDGYSAFILVLKYGTRLTKEELGTLKFLKKFFGQTFIEDYCVLVMTGGDNFAYEKKSEGVNFKSWCASQPGKFEELLVECDHRIVLFDNFTKDSYLKDKQLLKLLKEIDRLPHKGQRYTDINFRNAQNSRNKLRVENKRSQLREETAYETSYMIDKLEKVQASNDHKMKISPLDKILLKDSQLLKRLQEADLGTGELADLIQTATSIDRIASDEKKISKHLADDEETIRLQKEELQKKVMRMEEEKRHSEKLSELEKLKALKEREKQEKEIEKLKRENEEREEQHRKEMLEKKEEQRRKLDKQETDQKKTREKCLLADAANFAGDWVPGLRKVYDGANWLYNWWSGTS